MSFFCYGRNLSWHLAGQFVTAAGREILHLTISSPMYKTVTTKINMGNSRGRAGPRGQRFTGSDARVGAGVSDAGSACQLGDGRGDVRAQATEAIDDRLADAE